MLEHVVADHDIERIILIRYTGDIQQLRLTVVIVALEVFDPRDINKVGHFAEHGTKATFGGHVKELERCGENVGLLVQEQVHKPVTVKRIASWANVVRPVSRTHDLFFMDHRKIYAAGKKFPEGFFAIGTIIGISGVEHSAYFLVASPELSPKPEGNDFF
jgi:hypothetical protein